MRRARAARTIRTPVQQSTYQESTLGWYLVANGWQSVYVGKLAHPWWRRDNGPSMEAGKAWTTTLEEMKAKLK